MDFFKKNNLNKSKGYYFGNYNISANKYSGADFSKKCFVFSGQGAAFPGMFREYYFKFKIIRKRFKVADKLAKKLKLQKISDYILSPENLKKNTFPTIQSLALFTLEVALYELLISRKCAPKIITGHSFGELAVLVSAEVMSFEEMFDIVYQRDFLCPEPNLLGFMVALNANKDETKNILGEEIEYHISNCNSPSQTVISIPPNTVNDVKKLLEDKKIRFKILFNIFQPYHSPYMNNAQVKIEKYLANKKINFQRPTTPIFSSVVKKLIDKNNFNEEEIRFILKNQFTVPVDFIHQISSIYNLGCFNFIEIGVKKIFSGFVEDILKDKEIKTDVAVNLLSGQKSDTAKVFQPKNNKVFSLLSKTIEKITGYEINKISYEDKYQEDLGIDSIKKADILLTVLDESNISPGEDFSTSDFDSVKDTVVYLEKAKKAGLEKKNVSLKKETDFSRYTLRWEPKFLGNYFPTNLKKADFLLINVTEIQNEQANSLNKIISFLEKSDRKNNFPNLIIYSDKTNFKFRIFSSEEFQNNVSSKIIPFFRFFRKLAKAVGPNNFNLILVTQGKVSPNLFGYASFLKSLKKELPEVFFKHIRCDKEYDKKSLFDILEKEMNQPEGEDVFYKKGRRFVSEMRPATKENNAIFLGKNSVIVALGGAKGITFSLIKEISRKYRPIIYLVGRSSKEDKIVKTHLRELMKYNSKVYYKSLNATSLGSLDKLFSEIKKKHKKIDLIINGAGVVAINFLKDKTDKEINYEFNNKVFPAFNTLRLSLKYKPKRIINFASIISKYGGAGQSIYAGANELINRLTMEYNAAQKNSDSFALTIHWPPWDGLGMTQQIGILQNLKESQISLLEPTRANKLFSFDINFSGLEAVYYMDKFDSLSYGFALNNFHQYNALIGKMINPFGISTIITTFEKDFDLSRDNYLKDHTIGGLSYVPAAVGITMLLCLTKLRFGELSILKNIVMPNPIMVKNKPFKCFLEAEKEGSAYKVSLKSKVSYVSCQIDENRERTTIQYTLNKATNKFSMDLIYKKTAHTDGLYLGPIFQCINEAYLDKDNNPFFRIDNSRLLPVLGCGIYDKLIQWVDASFHALGLAAIKLTKTKYNRLLLPMRISKLTTCFHNEISNYLYLIPSLTKHNSQGIEGDIVVINEDGKIIIEMKGIFLKAINKESKDKLQNIKRKDK
ncbi:MAG: SDR family NAD(P)-dependent oxidoreductase [Candidatus Pacebacteria bacterium]|nr:SDR family NAD(P)-dependent oxidoreductase [Candidatus Paceibacterota bacterium]